MQHIKTVLQKCALKPGSLNFKNYWAFLVHVDDFKTDTQYFTLHIRHVFLEQRNFNLNMETYYAAFYYVDKRATLASAVSDVHISSCLFLHCLALTGSGDFTYPGQASSTKQESERDDGRNDCSTVAL